MADRMSALDGLRLPVVAAPMFIVSGPDLVIAQCKAGIVGSFPALNAREAKGEAVHVIKAEPRRRTGGARLAGCPSGPPRRAPSSSVRMSASSSLLGGCDEPDILLS